MRVLIDEDYLEEGAADWWRSISPVQRAQYIQSLWECGHGDEDGNNPHEKIIRRHNNSDSRRVQQ